MKTLCLLRACSRHRGLIRRHICSTTRRYLDEKETKIPLAASPLSLSKTTDVKLKEQCLRSQSHGQRQNEPKVSTTEEVQVIDIDLNNKIKQLLDDPSGSRGVPKLPTFDVRDVDPSTVKQVYYFDSLALVKSLQSKGFVRQQAEGLAECLVELIHVTLDHQGRHMTSKSQQEIKVQQLLAEIACVKKDMVILQKSEFSALRNETEKQSFEIRQIKDSIRDEIGKLKGQMTLDINLERSRAVEAHAGNQKYLTVLNQKIETEVANLRTKYEIYRNDVFKYAGGTVLTCAGLCMGILRLWS